MKVVFLDRASLKATVRKFKFDAEYIEHEKTAPEQVAARLADATVAIINKVPLRADTLIGALPCRRALSTTTIVPSSR